MNIGFDAKRAFCNYTGLGNYSRFVINALKDNFPNNNYNLYTPKIVKNTETELLFNNTSIVSPKGIYQAKILSSYWRSFSLLNYVKEDKIDLFHGLSNELPFFKKSSIRKVVTIHDLIFLRFPHLYSFPDRKIYEAKFKLACKQADKIVAISEQTKADIIDFFGIPEKKIEVIYQGCHTSFYGSPTENDKIRVAKKYNLPSTFLLSVGTIEERKNVLLILKAMKIGNIKEQLVIVGRATGYLKVLKEFIAKNNLDHQVIFLHEVNFIDLPTLYHLATIFIYPSKFEGFGIPIIEAQNCYLPVVAAKGSCLEEAGGGAAVYVNPQDPEELAVTLEHLLESLDTRNQMIKAGISHLEKFNENRIAFDLLQLYKSIS